MRALTAAGSDDVRRELLWQVESMQGLIDAEQALWDSGLRCVQEIFAKAEAGEPIELIPDDEKAEWARGAPDPIRH